MSRSPFASTVTVGEAVPCGTPILRFLEMRFASVPTGIWEDRLDNGLVTGADGAAFSRGTLVSPMMVLHYFREVPHEEPIPFTEAVVYEDAHLIVACKPHFLPVIPSGKFVNETLLTRLRVHFDEPELTPVNRIDRETAGLVLFSRQKKSRGLYQGLFMDRKVHKTYEALSAFAMAGDGPCRVENRLAAGEPWFRMAEVEGAVNAISTIEKIDSHGGETLYRICPLTGKKHQIRLHMCALGTPILNDRFYPTLLDEAPPDYKNPLKLLAKTLRFIDPISGKEHHFASPRSLFDPQSQ